MARSTLSKNTDFANGWSRLGERAFWVSIGLYLGCYAFLTAKGVYLHGDDFAYVESVAESLARGRLFTHEFLGPYNAFFTATGVGAYLLTGNFYLSTYGVLALFAGTNFVLIYFMFRSRLAPWPSAGLTMVVATFPFYLHKSLDYHGCLPTLTCVLVSLLAFASGRHKILYLAIFLAVSTRQNSLFLFLLPIYAMAQFYRKERKIPWKLGMYMVICLAALLLLWLNLNTTWFNHNLHPLPENLDRLALIIGQFCIGIFLGIFFLVISSLAVGGTSPLDVLGANFHRFVLPLFLSLVFGLVLFSSPTALVWFQTPLIGSLDHKGYLQIALKIVVFISFWFLDRRLLKLNIYLFLGLAYVGISCLRGFFWDYYFAELAFIALWVALLSLPETTRDNQTGRLLPRFLLGAVLLGNLGYAYLYKVLADKAVLANIVFEQLERQNQISPERMTGATWGFLGFKVFPLVFQDNPNHEDDDFTCYVQGDGIAIESSLPWKQRPALPTDSNFQVLDSGFASIGFLKLPYRVVDHKNPQGRDICHGEFEHDERAKRFSRPYPLNNAEWNEFIRLARTQWRR